MVNGLLGHASWTALALVALASPSLAQAQEEENAPDTAEEGQPPQQKGLGDIIVTAQRVEQLSQRAPLPIDVIQPEELAQQNVLRAEDLSRITPALAATGGAGGTTVFFVRGVGNTTVNAYSDPAISFNYDGVYIGRPSSTSGVFYDLERVEVLKGPQGTLYGRNATAGAINVIPTRPKLGEVSGRFMFGYGNYDWLTGEAAVNLPIGEKVAMRASGSVARRDAFLTDGTGNQREHAGRFQIYAEPNPDLTLRIGADYAHQGGASASGFYLGAVDPTFGPTGFAGYNFTPTGFPRTQGLIDPASNALLSQRFIGQLGRTGAVVDSSPFNDNDYWGITGELTYSTDLGTLTVQPAYREASLEYAFAGAFRRGYTKEEDSQTSLEIRWAGMLGDSIDYQIGGMYFDEDISANAHYNQQSLVPYQEFSTGTESWAGFSMVTFHVTGQLSLTAAGRYTSDKKSFDGTSNVYILFCGNPAPPQDFCPDLPFAPLLDTEEAFQDFYTSRGIPVTPVPLFVLPPQAGGSQTAPFVLRSPIVIDSALKNDKFTYRLAAQYEFTPRNMVYASFETGYHAGGFSFARGVETYEPETIRAYTLGSKNRLFENRVQLNVEAFLWKYRNQQFSQFGYDLGNPPSTVFLTRNIGNSTIKGVDIDLEVMPTETTQLSANVQYLDARYDSFVYYAPNQGLPPNTACSYSPTTQTTPGGTINVFAIDCSGNRSFNSPKWSLNLNARQEIPLGTHKAVLQGGTRYRSSSYSTADYLPYLKSRGNFVSYASITLTDADESKFVTLYVNNIEDNQRLLGGTTNPAGLIVSNAEQPRTYGVRIGSNF
ncbi:iron complex outermembrane receptor protein [Altererythrobacter atlanticus]|uniref:Ferripyoverdine receptor n=1 Tax=Croceibacterium atlanticum TaxID=1267766 RepID=A0A0F7KUG4_9SPHN|nr:TonB-dependent receptor [Croceibacterium atlanticum]AKH42882.1 Ferripyoverdine receptor precursor [Croceibacterium atlanticum]MBB5731662.1 iron complex outermembrane receptor protein [Croceibacterium atlanticum]